MGSSQYDVIQRQKAFDLERIKDTVAYYEQLEKYYLLAEKSAEQMVKGFREEYMVGTRSSTDLLDAENERFTVKVRRLNSQLDPDFDKINDVEGVRSVGA